MPRGPRLDAPGVLHHVMCRGIMRQVIFRDDTDRNDFVARLGSLASSGAFYVYAWALLPNHFHLLVRTAQWPLARSMRSLLTGYAGAFNRRHRRSGHVFQNRYKSIVCEEEPYFLELIRYIHLNPLRVGVVRDLRALGKYRYSGHATLLGRYDQGCQQTREVLEQFGKRVRQARAQYQRFVADGVERGRRAEFQGGGLVRSVGGWEAVRKLRRGREKYGGDERVLGSSEFVEQMRQEIERSEHGRRGIDKRAVSVKHLIERVSQAEGVRKESVGGGGRKSELCRVREGIAYLWVEWLGRSGRQLAEPLGVRAESVYRAARRGSLDGERWQRLLESK